MTTTLTSISPDQPRRPGAIDLPVGPTPEPTGCGLCGQPNGAEREGCLACGALLSAGVSNSRQIASPRAVWLSPHLLDVEARRELAHIIRLHRHRFVAASRVLAGA